MKKILCIIIAIAVIGCAANNRRVDYITSNNPGYIMDCGHNEKKTWTKCLDQADSLCDHRFEMTEYSFMYQQGDIQHKAVVICKGK